MDFKGIMHQRGWLRFAAFLADASGSPRIFLNFVELGDLDLHTMSSRNNEPAYVEVAISERDPQSRKAQLSVSCFDF